MESLHSCHAIVQRALGSLLVKPVRRDWVRLLRWILIERDSDPSARYGPLQLLLGVAKDRQGRSESKIL